MAMHQTSEAQESAIPLPEGISYSQLELEEPFSQGKFASFHRGCFKQTKVCVEVLSGSDEASTLYYTRKLRALTELRHPNIISLVAKTVDKPRSLVMEFVEDGNLRTHLQKLRQTRTEKDQLNFSLQIADGMEFMAGKNYIHGCLTGESIRVGQDGRLKICLVRYAHQVGETVMDGWRSYVSVEWTAPEVLTSGKFSRKSDVWSFGMVACEIFSDGALQDQMPGMATTPDSYFLDDFLGNIQMGFRRAPPRGCPNKIYDKMMECWRWEPSKRPEFTDLKRFFNDLCAPADHPEDH